MSDDGWTFLPEAAAPLMLAAIRAFGSQALSTPVTDTPLTAETCGSRLLQIVLAGRERGGSISDLVPMTDELGDEQRDAHLHSLAFDAFDEDPAAAARAADVIAAYHRERADRGEVQALVDLGDFLYWDRPEQARAAYQEAIDAGHLHALIDLALLLDSRFEDEDAAFAAYRRAISGGEPDLAAEAMFELGSRSWRRDEAAATAMLQQVIDTGHPRWAGQAMIFLGFQLSGEDAAEVLLGRATEAGDPETSAHASFTLGELLRRKGETEQAAGHWRHVIETRGRDWAGPALTSLVNLLAEQDNADGLRAAYSLAAEHENPDALYALTQLGQVLEAQGDISGAHQAWQQAIDAGCEDPDYWRERISPPPSRQRVRVPYPPDLPDLPDEFKPRNMIATALRVLDDGLPPLPPRLTADMAIPIAYWTARQHALVLVLTFSRWEGEDDSTAMACVLTFTRDGDTWTPPSGSFIATSWHHNPLTRPDSLRDLGGSPMVSGSGTKTMMHGRVIPGARELSLIQNGHEDRRPLDSHFGAWIVCTDDTTTPFEVEARDADGNAIARLSNWMAYR